MHMHVRVLEPERLQMTGGARVGYSGRLGIVNPKVDLVELTGFFDVFLGGGNLQ